MACQGEGATPRPKKQCISQSRASVGGSRRAGGTARGVGRLGGATTVTQRRHAVPLSKHCIPSKRPLAAGRRCKRHGAGAPFPQTLTRSKATFMQRSSWLKRDSSVACWLACAGTGVLQQACGVAGRAARGLKALQNNRRKRSSDCCPPCALLHGMQHQRPPLQKLQGR
jgi:hypothetical protein